MQKDILLSNQNHSFPHFPLPEGEQNDNFHSSGFSCLKSNLKNPELK